MYNESHEAAECAKLVGAKHNIIVRLKPGGLFGRKKSGKMGRAK